ncbi:coiled-coil domain-containing protein [Aliiglaciecola lipolytica]|uniref:Uncharacterized protein n=1 Tax=Aliiglaciecola lipolytica E3 TaxID=1127673 RepID=K6Y9P8_9ALTE|nr:hypothetical protein [Aliiglaciecola lipolytica]GAC13368.1 hypothetical protein GLIP_0722 [Aliiglaciecola lipolytica E3]
MKVIVAIGNSELWEQFALSQADNVQSLNQLSGEGGKGSQVCVVEALEDAQQLVRTGIQLSNFSVVIFYQQAEHYIASNIQRGLTLEEASALWIKKTKSVLQFYKQNRRSVKLVNFELCIAFQTDALSILKKFEIPLQFTIDIDLKKDFEHLLSCQFVRQEKDLLDLNARLAASSIPITESTEVDMDCESLLSAKSKRASEEKATNEIVEKLSLQLKGTEESLSALKRDRERVNLVSTEFHNELSLQKDCFAQQKKHFEHELELNELQMLCLQEEYEEVRDQLVKEMRNKVSVENSTQHKISKLNSQLIEANHEIELYLLHIAQVQEELESLELKNMDLVNMSLELQQTLENTDLSFKRTQLDLEKLNRELTNHQKCNSTLEDQLAKLRIEKSQLLRRKELELTKLNITNEKLLIENSSIKHKLVQVDAELDQIRTSVFWKTAEPVRKLVKAVGNIDKKKAKLQRDIGLLLTSEYFDAQWYLETYPDVAASDINPAEHYLKFGANEGRFPSPQFDGNWYLKRYPDVAEQSINPLIHYIKFGLSEGRSASPKMLTMQNDRSKG